MSDPPAVPRIAVIGHTNTGKTSLLRTLLRDERFGEVDDRPSTTSGVSVARLAVGGVPLLDFADTPGLEDSVGMLEWLESDRRPGEDGLDLLRRRLADPACDRGGRFGQEAMALRALLQSDAAFYVIDARDPVRARHRDELTILGWSARPVVPVLNFAADATARVDAWRDQLRRVNMHATAEFDTVVYDAGGERRLFEKLRTMLHEASEVLDAVGRARAAERAELVRAAARITAEMLVDVAAFAVSVPASAVAGRPGGRTPESPDPSPWIERLQASIRGREAVATRRMLDRFRFETQAVDVPELGIRDGRWGLDVFSPEAIRRWGSRAGGGAAAGAAVGLGIDAAVGGLSLGAGAVSGAIIGAVAGFGRTQGRRLLDRVRGTSELRADDATLQRLAGRQMLLAATLLRRGHAAVGPVRPREGGVAEREADAAGLTPEAIARVRRALGEARGHRAWAIEIAEGEGPASPGRPETADFADAGRRALVDRIGEELERALRPLAVPD
ncbi:MAG: GTPase/DUF3482 domain-containing protein [Planctomycetota bacterium]